MNTVHKIFFKKKITIKSNKIKSIEIKSSKNKIFDVDYELIK